MTRKARIDELSRSLDGLKNDALYHDLIRTYGEHSREVLAHLESCADVQRRGENHT